MGKRSEHCSDMEMVDAVSTIIQDQRRRDSYYAAEQRKKETLRKQGYSVKGDRMENYVLRVPTIVKAWLKEHPKSPEELRYVIIEWMANSKNGNTIYVTTNNISNNNTNTLTTAKGEHTDGAMHANVDRAMRVPLSPRIVVDTVNDETPESDGWTLISANKGRPMANMVCPECNITFTEKDHPITNKEGLLIHEECG